MKIAINGAGISGTTLAYWLRRFGHEPVLFEKSPRPRSGGYLVDFWGLGYEIAELMGVLPALHERAYLMERLSFVDEGGQEVTGMDLGPVRGALGGRFISLARSDLAAVLFQACEGIRTELGVSIVELRQERRHVVATMSDQTEESFDFVVGADGLHSQVRAQAFGPQSRFEVPLRCHVAAFRIRGYPRRDDSKYVSYTVPKRHVARVALAGGETLVLFVWRSDPLEPEPGPRWQKGALRQAFVRVGWEVPEMLCRLDEVDDFYFDRVSQIRMRTWASGRVALVGDAAACVSLLAGEGAGLAMIEAYVLAGELERAGGDPKRAFSGYETRLRSFAAAKQRAALLLSGFFAPSSALGLALRNVTVNTLSRPYLAKHLVPRALQEDIWVPKYGTPDWLRPRGKVLADERRRSARTRLL
jgi:2-polyprenyl-6-methoxyphenol hydroxylase-like FAD-dependent oxidoreductase